MGCEIHFLVVEGWRWQWKESQRSCQGLSSTFRNSFVGWWRPPEGWKLPIVTTNQLTLGSSAYPFGRALDVFFSRCLYEIASNKIGNFINEKLPDIKFPEIPSPGGLMSCSLEPPATVYLFLDSIFFFYFFLKLNQEIRPAFLFSLLILWNTIFLLIKK